MRREAPIYRTPREKLERRAADDEARAAQHRVKVRYAPSEYRAVCSCAWISEPSPDRDGADRAGDRHREEALT